MFCAEIRCRYVELRALHTCLQNRVEIYEVIKLNIKYHYIKTATYTFYDLVQMMRIWTVTSLMTTKEPAESSATAARLASFATENAHRPCFVTASERLPYSATVDGRTIWVSKGCWLPSNHSGSSTQAATTNGRYSAMASALTSNFNRLLCRFTHSA